MADPELTLEAHDPIAGIDALYRAYAGPLFRHLSLLVGDLAEDVMQDVFVRVAQQYSKIVRAGSPKRYLFRMARNLAFDFLKRNKIAPESLSLEMAGMEERPVEPLADLEELRRAIERLSLDQREAIGLHYFEELTFVEIAERIGVPPDTAASRVRYGLNKLRKLMPLCYGT